YCRRRSVLRGSSVPPFRAVHSEANRRLLTIFCQQTPTPLNCRISAANLRSFLRCGRLLQAERWSANVAYRGEAIRENVVGRCADALLQVVRMTGYQQEVRQILNREMAIPPGDLTPPRKRPTYPLRGTDGSNPASSTRGSLVRTGDI